MMNLKKRLTKSKVKPNEIGSLIRLVQYDNPSLISEIELSKAIEETFDIRCNPSDINAYNKLFVVSEDYELESRKQEFKLEIL